MIRRLELAIVASIVILDQATKHLVVAGMELYETIPVIPGLLNLTHIRNTGVAFGLFNTPEFAYKPVVVSLLALKRAFEIDRDRVPTETSEDEQGHGAGHTERRQQRAQRAALELPEHHHPARTEEHPELQPL